MGSKGRQCGGWKGEIAGKLEEGLRSEEGGDLVRWLLVGLDVAFGGTQPVSNTTLYKTSSELSRKLLKGVKEGGRYSSGRGLRPKVRGNDHRWSSFNG